jgi:Fungal rhodopsin domain
VGIHAGEFNPIVVACQPVLRLSQCWAIAAFTSNILQCTPVSFQWDKQQKGHCIPNALILIGMTNGVLSFVGDLVILALPVPMIWSLQIDIRRKIALNAIFLIGGFVCLTSIFRFVALAHINVKDITCKSTYVPLPELDRARLTKIHSHPSRTWRLDIH